MAGLVIGSPIGYVGESYVGASDAVLGIGGSTQGQSSAIVAAQIISATVSSGQGQTSAVFAVSFTSGDSTWVIKYRRIGRRG